MAEKLGLDTEDCAEILSLFIETTLSDLDALNGAIEAEDVPMLVHASHSIKGAAANLGLEEISSFAGEVEMKARKGILEGVKEAVDSIRGRVDLIKTDGNH
jgi:HPt (histidine-containing phosphotransfer) domain-containing protein